MKSTAYGYRRILNLSVPIIIGAIAQNVIMATDAFFMAGISEVSLNAVGLAGIFFSTIFVIGWGFSIGVQIIIARRHGEKNYPDIGKVVDNSFMLMIPFSLLLWGLMAWAGPTVLKNVIESEAVYKASLEYLDGRSWGIVPAFASLIFRSFFIGISTSSIITWATMVMAAGNIVLNYAFIFGNFGMPAWGIFGAGFASSLSEFFAIFCFVAYGYFGKFMRDFKLFQSFQLSKSIVRQITIIASPTMFQHFISHAAWFAFFTIIEKSGERALAVSVIIRIIYMFQMVPFWGLSSATNTLVSFAIGEGQHKEVMPLLRKVAILAVGGALLFIIPNMLIPGSVLALAADSSISPGIIEDAIPTLYMISLSLLIFGLALTWLSGVTGAGHTRTALVIEVGTILAYLSVAWYFGLYLKSPVHIIWIAEPIYFLLMGIASFIYMRSNRWKTETI